MCESDRELWNREHEENAGRFRAPDGLLEREVAGLKPGRALDLGCGSGENALMLARIGWSVTGVDWAEKAIEPAKKSATDRGLTAEFVTADITEWVPPGNYELVISTYALPGREKNQSALRTAVDALAPGGTIIVIEWDRSMCEVWRLEPDELPTPAEIAALLPGLEIERAEVREVDAFDPGDPRGETGVRANVAFVRARRPA